MTIGPKYQFEQVYSVEAAEDASVNPIAIGPEITKSGVHWMEYLEENSC